MNSPLSQLHCASPQYETARLDALRRLELLDTPPSEAFDRITRMAARGLVAREPCPSDQRGWFVAMTPAGRAAIAAAAPGHVAAVRRHFVDLLTPEQLATVDAVARTVLDHLPAAR